MNWTETRDVLIAAGMPAERLSEMWRPGIDLCRANLSGADLRRADLLAVTEEAPAPAD